MLSASSCNLWKFGMFGVHVRLWSRRFSKGFIRPYTRYQNILNLIQLVSWLWEYYARRNGNAKCSRLIMQHIKRQVSWKQLILFEVDLPRVIGYFLKMKNWSTGVNSLSKRFLGFTFRTGFLTDIALLLFCTQKYKFVMRLRERRTKQQIPTLKVA